MKDYLGMHFNAESRVVAKIKTFVLGIFSVFSYSKENSLGNH